MPAKLDLKKVALIEDQFGTTIGINKSKNI